MEKHGPLKAEGTTGHDDEAIQKYLEALSAVIKPLPEAERREIGLEIEAHLRSLIAMKREPESAVQSALQQFGAPAEIGRLLVYEWENREWDLSGMPLLQRLEKVREAMTEQSSAQTAFLRKRNLCLIASIVLALALSTARGNFALRNLQPSGLLDVAFYISCAAIPVVFLAAAWWGWRQRTTFALTTVARWRDLVGLGGIGVSVLLSLLFHQDQYAQLGLVATVVLVVALTLFEPSRKARTVGLHAAACGIVLPLMYGAMWTTGTKSGWHILPLAWVCTFAIGSWLWKGAKARQRAE